MAPKSYEEFRARFIHFYATHSIRAEATSAVLRSQVPIAAILKTVGWSAENTFRQYYNNPITNDQQLLLGN